MRPPDATDMTAGFGQGGAWDGPRICVIIPAHNEEKTIGATVRSVLRAGISPNDIVVVDDCSQDCTSEIVAGTGVRCLRNRVNLGKAVSIGRALSQMSVCDAYDLIALLDADTEVDPSYFTRMAAMAAGHPEVVLFVGQVKSLKHNWVTSSRAFDYTYMHDVYKTAQSRFSLITVGPGCASMYRSRAMRRIEITRVRVCQLLVRMGPERELICSFPISASPSSCTSLRGTREKHWSHSCLACSYGMDSRRGGIWKPHSSRANQQQGVASWGATASRSVPRVEGGSPAALSTCAVSAGESAGHADTTRKGAETRMESKVPEAGRAAENAG